MHAGVPALQAFIEGVAFPVLGACNMDTTTPPSLDVQKWHVFELQGVKVALLGYTLRATGSTTFSGGIDFSDPVRIQPPACASTRFMFCLFVKCLLGQPQSAR